jgi:hypothetical protein
MHRFLLLTGNNHPVGIGRRKGKLEARTFDCFHTRLYGNLRHCNMVQDTTRQRHSTTAADSVARADIM